MSYHKRLPEENKTDISNNLSSVLSKCLAIVLVPNSRKNSDNNIVENSEINETVDADFSDGNINQSSYVRKPVSSSGYKYNHNGKEILEDFKIRNKTCYWNPSLLESIKCLKYKGFVEPCTVLVTGQSIHLENLRSAWGRRVLKAPAGFVIERIGDVNSIQMEVIPQTQFMPLTDALCIIVQELNVSRIVATLDVVLEKLSLWYKDMNVPNQQLVIDTLGTLIKERKVFHTGSGYFVVTPDTSRLQNSLNNSYLPTNASWLPYHPMYVPVFQGELPILPSRAAMRSISCQVTTIEESSEEEDNAETKKDKDRGRKVSRVEPSHQLVNAAQFSGGDDGKSSNEGKRASSTDREFKRPNLFKVKGEKVKAVLPKTGNGHTEKGKGEKTSLFSKLFNRKKKDKSLMPLPPLPSSSLLASSAMTSTSGSRVVTEGKGEIEYATFSAQFPPPEWLWYQQQLEKQKRAETWVTHTSFANVAAAPTARPLKVNRSQSANVNLRHISRALTYNLNQPQVDYVPMSAASGLENKCADPKILKDCGKNFVKPLPVKPDSIYESFSNASSVKHLRLHQDCTNKMQLQRLSEHSVVDHSDMTSINSSNVYQSVLALSPVAHPQDKSTYSKLLHYQPLGPYHSTPVCGGAHDRTTYKVDGHESRDRIYGPPDIYHKRRSHRSQDRQHKVCSYYSSQGSDISYEYKGRLPKKNSSQAQSRDSGVNCAGLGLACDQLKKRTDHVYENTENKHHERHQSQKKQSAKSQLPGSRVQSDITAENESINVNLEKALDQTTPSEAFQGSSTTNMAYNSVVYVSTTDVVDGSSVMCQTNAGSYLESSEMPAIYNSLQSAFYEESNFGLASSFAVSQNISKGPQGVVELQSSPEKVIVDVAGSPSEVEERYGLYKGNLRPVVTKGAKEVVVSMEDSAQILQWTCKPQKVDVAEICNDQSDDDAYGVHRELGKGQRDGEIHGTVSFIMGTSGNGVLSQPVDERRQDATGDKNNFIPDSGFSSPMNSDTTGDKASSSNQSNSTSENSCEANDQDNNNIQQLHHQITNDNSSSPRSLTGDRSGISQTAGREHQSKSGNDNLCSGALSQKQDCEQITLQNSISLDQQNNLQQNVNLFYSHFQQSVPPHQQLWHDLDQPTVKNLQHLAICDNPTSDNDYNFPVRVPLHSSAVLNIHRHHCTDRPSNLRSNSVNLWKSGSLGDHTNCEERQQSMKYELSEEFRVMGVL